MYRETDRLRAKKNYLVYLKVKIICLNLTKKEELLNVEHNFLKSSSEVEITKKYKTIL